MNWRRFTYQTFLFLIPVVLVVIGIEVLVRNIPSGVQIASEYMEQEREEINTLILGASQNKRGINPEFLTDKALNLAGTRQGYKTDYYLLHDLYPQLPKLKRVIIASTYRHFESSPSPKNFWKHRAHLYYFHVNAFERTTYFKDQLLFLGRPDFYSSQLESYYLKKERSTYNRYGFQTDTLQHRFVRMGYDDQKIKATYKTNYPPTNIKYMENGLSWFNKILRYCQEQELEVILALTPVYDHYQKAREPDVLRRRDSIIANTKLHYPDLRILDQEKSNDFTVFDYMNENHLNPRGAAKFTKKLDAFLKGH